MSATISFPRSIDRGLIEAILVLPESGIHVCFRDQLIAASLKPQSTGEVTRSQDSFPRSIDRGLIEASFSVRSIVWGRSFRDQLIAASLKPCGWLGTHAGRRSFRDQLIAASLKRYVRLLVVVPLQVSAIN